MVRFSCFNAHIHSHKSKKTVPPSMEAMHKSLQDCSQIKALKNSTESTSIINNDRNVTSSSSIKQGWESEEMMNKSNPETDIGVCQTGCLKKSQSLGSGLYREGKNSCNSADDETDQIFFHDESHDLSGLVVPDCNKNQGVNPLHLYQEDLPSLQVSSDLMNNESIFSIGDPQYLEKEAHDNFDAPLFDDCAGDSGDHSPRALPAIVKSCSVPNIRHHTPISGECSPLMYSAPRSRSSEDLHALEMRRKENSIHEVKMEVMQEQARDDGMCKSDKNNGENLCDEVYDSYNYVGSAKDWIMPNLDEVKMGKNLEGESSVHWWHELPNKDFKIKRIEDWVIDLQHCSSLEETDEPSFANVQVKRGSIGLTTAKLDAKVIPGMEAAKRYISSLSAAATTAQLANHGLVVVPFLSAFVSLRVLNLSGNAIVRITAGALPRGLHMLNLSKNNISTIEGLRELTRLRILDLSYNRIIRIGHGLASCSSLKELYLAGNKISEVEGLHRLLKLNVLDLRFNKISTAKCLGQLAANYNSLQAISLEGNPAQKNVGDEQLKKYLQGLLTHLAYYNRQPIKVSTLKDAADRSVRLGVGAHQFDRGLRSELRPARKGTQGVAAHKLSSSSTHARKGQAVVSPKLSRGRHGRLPPSGIKATTNHRHHHFDFGSKLMSLKQDLSMRRSRSEGTLGAL